MVPFGRTNGSDIVFLNKYGKLVVVLVVVVVAVVVVVQFLSPAMIWFFLDWNRRARSKTHRSRTERAGEESFSNCFKNNFAIFLSEI